MPVPANELLVPVGTISIDKHKSDKQTFSDASVKAVHTTGATTMSTPSNFSINTLVAKYPGVTSDSTGTTVSGTLTVPGVAQVQAMTGATYTAESMSTNVLSAIDDVGDTLVFDGKKVVLNSDVLVAGRIDTIDTPVMNVVDKIIKIGAIDVNGDDDPDMDDFLRDGSGVVVPGPPANLPVDVLSPDLYEHSFKWTKKAGDFDSSGNAIAPHSRPAWDFKSAIAVSGVDTAARQAKFVFSPNFTSTSASLGMYYKVGDTSTLVSNFATEPFDWPGAPVWPADAVPTLPPIARGSVVNYQFGSTPVVRSASRGTRDVSATNVAANTDRFSVVAGTLPSGLTLSSTGLLSGTVTSVQSYSFTVRAGCKYPSQYSDYVFSMDVAPEIIWQTSAGAISKLEKGVLSSRNLVATNCVTFAVVSGALPTGVSMTSGGVLSGTPSADGYSAFTVRATSTNAGVYVDREFSLQVATTPVWSTAGALTDVAKNGPLSAQLSATNTTSYAVQAGALPAGASLTTSGLLTGPASAAGTFTFTIRATGSAANAYADREFTLIVANSPSWVTAASMANIAASVSVSIQFDATYAGTYAVQSGDLPTGLSMSGTGLLTGTPTTVQSATFTVRAVSAASPLVYTDRPFTLSVVALPVWSTAAGLTDVAKDAAYSVQLAASSALTYSLQSGTLPAGVVLSAAGLLSGTPTAGGNFAFTIRATGDAGNAVADRAFTLVVIVLPVWSTAATLASGAYGSPYSVQLAASNAVSYSVQAGTLPAGISMSSGGLLSGTPTAAGTSTFTVRATGSTATATADRAFTIVMTGAWTAQSLPALSQWRQTNGTVTYTSGTNSLKIISTWYHPDYPATATFDFPAGYSTADGYMYIKFDFVPQVPWTIPTGTPYDVPVTEGTGLAVANADIRYNGAYVTGGAWPTLLNENLNANNTYRFTFRQGPSRGRVQLTNLTSSAVVLDTTFVPTSSLANSFDVRLAANRPITITNLTSSVARIPQTDECFFDFMSTAGKAACRAAYSTRRLLTAYTGPTVKVLRSSDNAEQDFYCSPTGVAGTTLGGGGTLISTWLAGATPVLQIWYDQSGKAAHAYNAVGGTTLTLNLSGDVVNMVSFTANAFMNVPDGTTPVGDSPYTISLRHGQPGGKTLFGAAPAGIGNNQANLAVLGENYISTWRGNTFSAGPQPSNGNRASWTYDQAERAMYVNGALVGSQAASGHGTASNGNCISKAIAFNEYGNTPLYNVSVYSMKLSDADMRIAEA